MRSGVWLLVLVAGCRFGFERLTPDGAQDDARLIDAGAPPAFVPYWTSGTRMRSRLLMPVEGGDPYWLGWRDMLYGMDCQSALAADGTERCVHVEVNAMSYFADASCTVPVAVLRPRTCGSGTHAFTVDPMGRRHAHALGAVHAGAVYETPGACAPAVPPPGTLHLLGAEVPVETLVAAQYTSVQIGDYERQLQTFNDGARLELGTIQIPAGSCFPSGHGTGPSECVPNVKRATAVYLDAGCTQRAYFWDRQSYDPPNIAQFTVVAPAACNSTFEHHSVSFDVTAATHYRQTTAGCMAVVTPALGKLYTSTLLSDPFPVGSIVIGQRRGRLGYLYWVGPDDQAIVVRYWDHDLGMPCLPINGSDGKLRCLPAELKQITGSPDATCASAMQGLTPACFPGAPVDGPDYTSCTDSYTVRTLPNVTTTASVFGDSCAPLTLASGFYDRSSPGGALDPTMFAELTEVIE